MKNNKTRLALLASTALFLGLVSWSPTPSSDDVIIGSTSMTSPTGQILVVGSGSSGTAKRSFILGIDNVLNNDRANTLVSGSTNTVDATSTLVSGFANTVSSPTSTEVRVSGVIGGNNILTSPHGYVMGYENTVNCDYGHAYGYDLLMNNASKCVALGRWNAAMTSDDVLVVGTGSSDSSRDTALSAKSDGSLILGSAISGSVVLAKAQGDISMGEYGN